MDSFMKSNPSSNTETHNLPQTARALSGADERAAFAQVMAAISRLETIVDTETNLLDAGQKFDLRDITARKSRGLYDLSKALRSLGDSADPELLETPMRALRIHLERNRAVLANHLEAVGEVAELMRRAVEMDEADGTYSVGRGPGSAK